MSVPRGQLREKGLKSFVGSLPGIAPLSQSQPSAECQGRGRASDSNIPNSLLSSHLGWAAATAANSVFHMGLPKMVLCLRPVTVSVAVSKCSATLLAWAGRDGENPGTTHEPPSIPHHRGASIADPTNRCAWTWCLKAVVMFALPLLPSLASLCAPLAAMPACA